MLKPTLGLLLLQAIWQHIERYWIFGEKSNNPAIGFCRLSKATSFHKSDVASACCWCGRVFMQKASRFVEWDDCFVHHTRTHGGESCPCNAAAAGQVLTTVLRRSPSCASSSCPSSCRCRRRRTCSSKSSALCRCVPSNYHRRRRPCFSSAFLLSALWSSPAPEFWFSVASYSAGGALSPFSPCSRRPPPVPWSPPSMPCRPPSIWRPSAAPATFSDAVVNQWRNLGGGEGSVAPGISRRRGANIHYRNRVRRNLKFRHLLQFQENPRSLLGLGPTRFPRVYTRTNHFCSFIHYALNNYQNSISNSYKLDWQSL